MASTVAGFISDGVPPPMKMLVTVRGPTYAASPPFLSERP
jgi:hypothetical protein